MHLDLDPDQQLFASSTREFLTSSLGTAGDSSDGVPTFDPAWWARGADLGWFSPAAPEEFGGGSISGRPLVELSLIAQAFGEHCAPGPLTVTAAVLSVLTSDQSRAEIVEQIISGQTIATLAHYEPDRDWLRSTGTQLVTEPDGTLRLTGVKDRVECGTDASLILVTATSEDGPVLVLVDPSHESVTVTPTWSLDAGRQFSRIELTATPLGVDQVVATGTAAAARLRRARTIAAALAAAESCGTLSSMFNVTMRWLGDRYTFGRPLSSYQVLKHRMADNKTWLESSLAITSAAFSALDADAGNADDLVSAAKSYVGDKSVAILQDFVQMHGGLGVTWEHQLHLYLRRAVCNRVLYGTPDEHRAEITAAIEVRESA